jgi:hypothetical protein
METLASLHGTFRLLRVRGDSHAETDEDHPGYPERPAHSRKTPSVSGALADVMGGLGARRARAIDRPGQCGRDGESAGTRHSPGFAGGRSGCRMAQDSLWTLLLEAWARGRTTSRSMLT